MKSDIRRKLEIWLLATRPKTLWAAIAPVIIGTAIAFADNNAHWVSAFVTLITVILIQIGTNFANDYFDFVKGADTKERYGPIRATQAGLVSKKSMKIAFITVFMLAFLTGLYLINRGGWPILIIGLLSIFFGILYTGGPYPLGYNGLGDVFVLIFFGPVAVGGTYYAQALEISYVSILAGLSPGLLSTAILTVNNLRDIYHDKKAGKKTLAVRFGELFTRLEYVIAVSAACLMPLVLMVINEDHPYALATIFVLLFSFPTMKEVFDMKIGPDLNKVLAKTGKILLFYSIIFSIGWIL